MKLVRVLGFLVALGALAALLYFAFDVSVQVILAFAAISLLASYWVSTKPWVDRDVADRVYYAMMMLSVAALFAYQEPQKQKLGLEQRISQNNNARVSLDGELALLKVIEDDSPAVVSYLQKGLDEARVRALANPELLAGTACADAYGIKIGADPPRSRLDQLGTEALHRAIAERACEDLTTWARELRQRPPLKITDLKDIPQHRGTLRGVTIIVAGNTLSFDRLNALLFAGGDTLDFPARRAAIGAQREMLVTANGEFAKRQQAIGTQGLAQVLFYGIFVEWIWPFVLISMLALKWARTSVRN